MSPHIITNCVNFTLDLKQHGFCGSPLILQTLWPRFFLIKEVLCNAEQQSSPWPPYNSFPKLINRLCFVVHFRLRESTFSCALFPSTYFPNNVFRLQQCMKRQHQHQLCLLQQSFQHSFSWLIIFLNWSYAMFSFFLENYSGGFISCKSGQ